MGFAAGACYDHAMSREFSSGIGRSRGRGGRGRTRAGVPVLVGLFLVALLSYLAALPANAQNVPPGAQPTRSQEPRPPLPYRSEDVRYRNASAGIDLAGTLTIPQGSGPFPAVVLISGSGPQNRDAELFGHRSFLVLADH